MKNENEIKNKIKLYSLLVDQIQKYNTILWQFPTLLSAANIVSITQISHSPIFLFFLSLINFSLIFAFYKMILRQKQIINKTKVAERDLQRFYGDYVPNFSELPKDWIVVRVFLREWAKAPNFVTIILAVSNFLLLVYSVIGINRSCSYLSF